MRSIFLNLNIIEVNWGILLFHWLFCRPSDVHSYVKNGKQKQQQRLCHFFCFVFVKLWCWSSSVGPFTVYLSKKNSVNIQKNSLCDGSSDQKMSVVFVGRGSTGHVLKTPRLPMMQCHTWPKTSLNATHFLCYDLLKHVSTKHGKQNDSIKYILSNYIYSELFLKSFQTGIIFNFRVSAHIHGNLRDLKNCKIHNTNRQYWLDYRFQIKFNIVFPNDLSL